MILILVKVIKNKINLFLIVTVFYRENYLGYTLEIKNITKTDFIRKGMIVFFRLEKLFKILRKK